MVIKILEKLFVLGVPNYAGFPLPNYLLPSSLQAHYHDYYLLGSGSILLYLLLIIFVYQSLFFKTIERYFARVTLFIILYFSVKDSIEILSLVVVRNVLNLPIVKLPLSLLYIFLICISFLLLNSFRNYLSRFVNIKVIHSFDFLLLILILLATLPLYSGEIW